MRRRRSEGQSDTEFWIFDFGFWIGGKEMNKEFSIVVPGFLSDNPKSKIQNGWGFR
jgi:hypothetical protein